MEGCDSGMDDQSYFRGMLKKVKMKQLRLLMMN